MSSKHVDEQVVLTCENPADDGNPPCDDYTWNRKEGNDGIDLPTSQTFEFLMKESLVGNYTCKCGNDYNTSGVSNGAEVIFLTGPAPASCRFSFI